MPFDNTRTLDASDGNYMVIGGIRYPIINSEIEAGRGEDRTLWRIVTEGCEPVNVPVRRQIDGKWQTVMITRSEWERTRTEEQPPAADATVRPTTVKSVGPSFRDSGGFPVLPPYSPPAP